MGYVLCLHRIQQLYEPKAGDLCEYDGSRNREVLRWGKR